MRTYGAWAPRALATTTTTTVTDFQLQPRMRHTWLFDPQCLAWKPCHAKMAATNWKLKYHTSTTSAIFQKKMQRFFYQADLCSRQQLLRHASNVVMKQRLRCCLMDRDVTRCIVSHLLVTVCSRIIAGGVRSAHTYVMSIVAIAWADCLKLWLIDGNRCQEEVLTKKKHIENIQVYAYVYILLCQGRLSTACCWTACLHCFVSTRIERE